jgi:hypothetical protein
MRWLDACEQRLSRAAMGIKRSSRTTTSDPKAVRA